MSEEPTSPPQPGLDETLDAKPYEPPKPRPCGLANAALGIGLSAVVVCGIWMGADARSGVLAVLPLVGMFCALIAVVLGSVAMVKVGRSKGSLTGTGRASAGITFGVVVLLMALGLLMVLRIKNHAPRTECKGNLRQMSIALHLYADANSGMFPAEPHLVYPDYSDNPRAFFCTSAPSKWRKIPGSGRIELLNPSYVYVAGLKADDPGDCVVAFDRPGNHGDARNVLCLDSSVQQVKAPAPGGPDRLKEMLDQTREAVRKRGGDIRLVGE